MKILLITHITMGYGSPEMLNLYQVLISKGHSVFISDQEDNVRQYYPLRGINRFYRENINKMTPADAANHRSEMIAFVEDFNPDILISSFLPFLTDDKFPLNNGSYKVFYASEVFSNIDCKEVNCLISPNEDRLDLLSKGLDIKKFVIYNAPLLSDKRYLEKSAFLSPEVLNVLYQGQISKKSGVDVLLRAIEISKNTHLHLCGDIRDQTLKSLVYNLEKSGKLTYHGFIKQKDLNVIRKECHVGFIGWREDADVNDISIKYCCPTKLYDYISFSMPVIFLKNHALNTWNKVFKFGISTTNYDDCEEVAQILNTFYSKSIVFDKYTKQCTSLYKTQLNYEFQSEEFIRFLESKDYEGLC